MNTLGYKRGYKIILCLLLLLLVGCDIEGGVSPPSTPGQLPMVAIPVVPTVTPLPKEPGFRVGLLDEPADLLPYHDNAVDQHITAPVSELLFPSPLLALNYVYTSTGVLDRIPSFQNGDVELRDVDVYIDETGNIMSRVPERLNPTEPFSSTQVLTTTAISTKTTSLSETSNIETEAESPSETSNAEIVTSTQELSATVYLTSTQQFTATQQVTMTQEMTIEQKIAQAEEQKHHQPIETTEVISKVQQIVVTYHWNPLLRWSDGIPVTADDSVFAYQLAQTQLLGDDALNRYRFIERYERVDDHTTRAFLHPDVLHQESFDPEFTDPSYIQTFWIPLPRHILKDMPISQFSSFVTNPIGYGPYKIEQREKGSIRMAYNQFYYGSKPQQAHVSFIFLPGFDVLRTSMLASSLDVAVSDDIQPTQFQFLKRDLQLGLFNVNYVPSPIWEHLDFNLDVTLLQDIRVRRAIAYATNRQAMVETLFDGQVPVMNSWIVPQHWATAPDSQLKLYPYDHAEANRLLDEVGELDSDGNGVRDAVSIDLLTTTNSPLRAAIAEQFKADMAVIGIVVNVHMVPLMEMNNPEGPLFRRQFHIAQFAWITNPDPGGLSLWSCRAVPSEHNGWIGNNFSGWCFYDADQAIRIASTSQHRDERLNAYIKQQQLFTQELPSLPLFQRLNVVLSNTQMKHLAPDPIAPITWNIVQWEKVDKP